MSDFLDGAKPVAASAQTDFLADSKPVAAQPPPEQKGALQSFADSSGLSAVFHPLLHPIDTITTKANNTAEHIQAAVKAAKSGDYKTAFAHALMADPLTGDTVSAAVNEGTRVANAAQATAVSARQHGALNDRTVEHAIEAIPIAGGVAKTAADQEDAGNTAGMVGTVAGFAASLLAPEAIKEAAPTLSRVPSAASKGVERAGRTLYPKNVSVAQDQIAAQGLIKALVPDAAAIPGIKSAAAALPDALASAEKNGTAINGKLDLQKALTDRAAEVQGHYDNAILKPNAGDLNAVPDNYNGGTTTQGRATLQQISDRVDDINSELKSNFRKKLASQTTEANASDADLIAEKQGLTNILHNRLATLTGLAPEDIAGLRQNAGKLRSLAQEVGDSANKDTVTAGRADTSGGTTSMKNPLEGVVNRIGGGQEIIGNRTLKDALQNFKPAETPLPQPKPPGPGIATTPAAAQQEFAHQQTLEQAAQNSSASRSADAAGVRERARLAEGGSSAWASKGYNNVMQQITADKPAGIKTGDLAAIAQTPEGRSLFMRASSLQPGSVMLKQIVNQLATLAKGAK